MTIKMGNDDFFNTIKTWCLTFSLFFDLLYQLFFWYTNDTTSPFNTNWINETPSSARPSNFSKLRRRIGTLAVSGERTMQPQVIDGMMPWPTGVTKVLEAFHRPTKERSRIDMALATHRIFQVRVYLHFLGEFWWPDLDEWGLDSFHETSIVVESYSSRSYIQ